MGWEFVERWRTPTWVLTLNRIEDVFAKAWRVEWKHPGASQSRGESFTGDTREHDARTFLAARKAELGGDWKRIS